MNTSEQLTTEEWIGRLEKIFGHQDRLQQYMAEEKQCGVVIANKYRGYHLLTDSFLDFYIETLQIAHSQIQNYQIHQKRSNYMIIFLFFVTILKSLRAAENIYAAGYPLDGYALLRDLKDRAIFIAAIISNVSSFSALYGYRNFVQRGETITPENYKSLIKERKKEEKRVFDRMLWKNSCIEEKYRKEIEKWENLFHEEVHGSRLTFFYEGVNYLANKKSIPIAPKHTERSAALYMNRMNEVSWMVLRCLPFLQLKPRSFGESWDKKWEILDESFLILEKELSKMGKSIADVIIYLINAIFNMTPDTYYIDRDSGIGANPNNGQNEAPDF